MSTLSGLASKGEKGKSKFQSLDINTLYRNSRGESSETQQQKNTQPRKHGMQPLGKVPATRRAPANLPSLKSEYSGNDPAVSLVPSGGTGWGSKPGETGPTPTSQTSSQTATLTSAPASQTTSAPAGAPAVAPTPTAPPVITQTPSPSTQKGTVGGGVVSSGGDKTWSSVTCGAEAAPSFLAHQSPQFQQEFPSLSGEGVGPGPPPPKTDTQYGPGPSLRPQTEGSWIQGGGTRGVQGTGGQVPPGSQQTSTQSQDGVRNNLAQFGVGGAQGGQQSSQVSSSFRQSIFPMFMSNRGGGSYPSMFSGNYQNSVRPRYQYQPDNRVRPSPQLTDPEDVIPRPIIREEDLNRMDELASDASWAAQDDIDYNQTLTFSDEETEDKDGSDKRDKGKSSVQQETKDEKKETEIEKETRDKPNSDRVTSPGERNQPWQGRNTSSVPPIPPSDFRATNRSGLQGNRNVDEDEMWRERRRQQSEVVAAVTEKAKQRKEEEEKRFEESRAKSHLVDSDKKKGKDEGDSMPAPSEWEKEEKSSLTPLPSIKEGSDNFRQMTQLEGRTNFGRDRERERDREMRSERENEGQLFQRFNNSIPPRFQNKYRNQPYNRAPSSVQSQGNYESRWNSLPNNQNSHFQGKTSSNDRNRRNRTESELSDKDREKELEDELKERDRRDRHTPELNSDRDRHFNVGRFRRGERSHDTRKGGYSEPISDYNRSYQRDRDYERDRNKDVEYKQREKDDRDEPEWEGRRGADWESNRHYDDRSKRIDSKKSTTESFKTSNDGFEEQREGDWRGERERPQRPDSRDSRASRDSRNSRESNREEQQRLIPEVVDNEYSWGDNEFEKETKEEKPTFRKETSYKEERRENQQHRQREGHVPGPITREKMEAYEYKHNLAQGDKKESSVLGGGGGAEEETWGKSNQGGGQGGSVSWADAADDGTHQESSKSHDPIPNVQEQNKDDLMDKLSEKEELDKKKDNGKKEREKTSRSTGGGGRSVRGGRQGGYNTGTGYAVYNRQGWGTGRSDPKRGAPSRGSSQKHWNQSESEVSGDEMSVSTESGKEDKKDRKQPPRSPKSGGRKMEKDGRNKESQQIGDCEKPATPKQERKQGSGERKDREREGFAPRGEPSRRGRGGGFRTRGAISNISGGHYGPPGSKSPFPHQQVLSQQDDDQDKNPVELTLEEKMKLKQQALAAGITGAGRQSKGGELQQMRKLDGNEGHRMGKGKPKFSEQGEEAWETTSETSDTEGKGRKGFPKNKAERKPANRGPIGDKRGGYNTMQMNGRPCRNEDIKSGDDLMSDKKRVDKLDGDSPSFANNGFQEVRSKKLGKEGTGTSGRPIKDDLKRGRGKGKEKGSIGGQGTGRGQGQSKPFPREWCINKPPRLQRIENIRKQQQHHHDVSDMNKINQNVSLFLPQDVGCPPPAPPPSVNAWDKPITATLRTTPPPSANPLQLGGTINSSQDKTGMELNDHGKSGTSSQTSSPSAEKALTKMAVEKSLLDGATPPVQTIIFENTNYKATPGEITLKSRYNMGQKGQRMDKGRGKIDDELDESHGMGLGGFKSGDLKGGDKTQESIQMSMAFNKNEDNADMKLDFAFDSDLSQLTDDKSNIPRSIHLGQTSAADLDQKIASVKKVWDNPADSMMEHQHHVDEGHGVVSTTSSFTPPFGSGVDASLDPTASHQVDDSAFPGTDYSSGPQIQGSNSYANSGPSMMKADPNSASGNVSKMKQQPQATAVVITSGIGPHSPPPFTQPGHINYQAPFATGMPGIPSPPTGLFGNAQQVPNQGELYHSYQLSNAQVLSGQGRSTFSQYQYNLSQGLSQTSAYQTPYHLPTPPPPNPPPDMFSLYRPQPGSSFGGSQQMSSNPSTVLISSTSNSLMSASVKSSNQGIGAIGSKTPFQSTPPPSQLYVQYDSTMFPQNFMASSQIVPQRAGVHQTIQASPSFYSNSGAQTGLFTGSSMLGTANAQAPLHSAAPFGMQSFGTQSPAPAPTANPNPVGVQSYTSQMGHIRGGGQGPGGYLKPAGAPAAQHPADSAKSPSSNQEVLQCVFSAPQIASPKSRGTGGVKQGGSGAPQQPSPTQTHHKFTSYQPHAVSQANLVMQQQGGGRSQLGGGGGGGVRGGVSSAPSRYPLPIQRPNAAYPQQGAMMRHSPRSLQSSSRPPLNNKIPGQYFQQQGNSVKLEGSNLEAKSDTGSECKIEGGGGKQLVQSQCEKAKEESSIDAEQ